jgi:hypothetical protein
MKKSPSDNNEKNQVNIGYQNTKTENDQDTVENNHTQTTDTDNDEGPKDNEKDSEGLRSESGSKSTGKAPGSKAE